MSIITLGLIRHGTTEWNLLGKMQGHIDIPLAEVGRMQARMLGRRLAAEKTWDGIITSDLQRAKETALIISEETGIPVTGTDQRLRERSFGQLEGTTTEERIASWGEGWRELDLGLESDKSLLSRWDQFYEQTLSEHHGKRLLVVSHGGYIAPVLERLMGKEIKEHLSNTSLSIIRSAPSGWEFPLINCTMHLEDLQL